MPRYRKKPVIIEAFQLTPDRSSEPDWWTRAIQSGKARYTASGAIIETLEGDHLAQFGDYIVRGVKGELYPVKPDIFEETYEIVEEA